MKAAVYKNYGPPEVISLTDIERPVPKSDEVLIRVKYSTVNRTDAGFRSAEYFVSRFWSGLIRPKYPVLGCEFAGLVEAAGSDVSEFKIGDRVFGYNDKSFGGHAEYLCINVNDAIVGMPNEMDFETAAAMSEGAHYALCDIRAAKVFAGQHVMVYGATGAIGSAAVQLLKHFKTEVTAVCNSKNVDLIRSLGADEVIDYQKEDFTKIESKFDFIFDAVGKSSFGECKPLLKDKGVYISTELGKNGENIWLAISTPLWNKKRLLFPIPSIHKSDLIFLKTLFENKEFRPLIDRTYPLEQIVDAYKYVESGQKTGNVLIKID